VRKSTIKVLNAKVKYTKSKKHKVLLIGDSHIRGSAASLIVSLGSRFEVCGVVKPGSNTETLIMTAKSDMEAITKKDFLIICSGTNDMDRNSSKNALNNIINVIKHINQTNIIIVNVPHRYDVTVHPHINSSVEIFNSKLLNPYPANDYYSCTS
jgi:trans-2-enoyl-CoA reductase